MEKTRRFTVEVTPELHTELKIRCARANMPMTSVMRRLLEREVEHPSVLAVKPKTKGKSKLEAGAA